MSTEEKTMDSTIQEEKGNTPATPVEAAAPSQPVQISAPKASSPAPSTASSTGRPPYIPQFSAATQMILKRINSKPGSLSSALSSASSTVTKTSIEKSTYEDAKRRLVMNMNTSLTMSMPMPMPKQSSSYSSKQKFSTATTMRMPMNDAFQLRTPAPAKTPTQATAKSAPSAPASSTPAQKPLPAKLKSKAQRGTKRKRGKDDNDEDGTSSLSELSSSEGSGPTPTASASAREAQSVLTMTKSGRQVQKPSQYNPSAQSARDAAQKRKAYGKQRTFEQALCKVCTRGLSLAANQVVFCDGCNCCWHQMCHDPYIDDDFVSNEARSWFCRGCVAKRERHLARKKSLDGFKGVGWAGKSGEQKRSYLSGVPHAQLVNIIMYSTELHPDLPIFPANEPKRGGTQAGRPSSYDSARVKTDSNINVGPTHYSSKVSTPDSHSVTVKSSTTKGSTAESQAQATRESSTESVPAAWPKVGQGCLVGLEMDEDDLKDDNDYEAFSVTSYDAKGKKIMENGMAV
ncbi:uncharacterized protein GGS22DRAFT_169089 [Annulohypoxylon maeteangense]|uniref:uncharacterized protein n=1 Tax=Annulohypoxylon maeteangense TaxID=1927788 RepID=UPI0020088F45|nr:uncharacterized protein GGS22DRAFT_169089 [Annulohypoxylon maeteangense]KAI0882925.1 hypothetical protein GGS22DRAFT_169089 [Annulohypoxylon maeteangense]